jgi:hypothetical protein
MCLETLLQNTVDIKTPTGTRQILQFFVSSVSLLTPFSFCEEECIDALIPDSCWQMES